MGTTPDRLRTWLEFLKRETSTLRDFPFVLFQQAANQPHLTPPAQAARERAAGMALRPWLAWTNKPAFLDPCIATFAGHEHMVRACAFSPDGRHIASAAGGKSEDGGSTEGELFVWDVVSGERLLEARGSLAWVNACAYSPNGNAIATASRDRTIRLWDSRSGRELRRFECEGAVPGWITCAFSPDGPSVAIAVAAKIVLWDSAGGDVIRTIEGQGGTITTCTFDPGGDRLATATRDGKLAIWNVHTGELIADLAHDSVRYRRCDFSPDGRWLIAVAEGCFEYRIWDTTTRETLDVALDPTLFRRVLACRHSPDGTRIIIGAGVDWTPERGRIVDDARSVPLAIHDAGTRMQVKRLDAHQNGVGDCAFAPDGRTIATAGDRVVKLWDVAAAERYPDSPRHFAGVSACALSSDGARAASGCDRGILKVWNAEAGTELIPSLPHPSTIWSCSFSPSAREIAASFGETYRKGGVRVTDLDSLQARETPTVDGEVWSCAYTPDGSRLFGGGRSGCYVWRSSDCAPLLHLPAEDSCFSPALSPEGRRAIVRAGRRGSATLYDLATGKVLVEVKGETGFAFAPDGVLFSAAGESTLWIYDSLTGSEVAALPLSYLTSCVFSPDGRRLFCASSGGDLYSVDLLHGFNVSAQSHRSADWDQVRCCAFTSDARYAISAGSDLRVWDAQTLSLATVFPLRGGVTHRVLPHRGVRIAVGDRSGDVSLLELIAADSPAIATATLRYYFDPGTWDEHPMFCCPWCGVWAPAGLAVPAASDPLTACANCKGALRLNPFVADARRGF